MRTDYRGCRQIYHSTTLAALGLFEMARVISTFWRRHKEEQTKQAIGACARKLSHAITVCVRRAKQSL